MCLNMHFSKSTKIITEMLMYFVFVYIFLLHVFVYLAGKRADWSEDSIFPLQPGTSNNQWKSVGEETSLTGSVKPHHHPIL